MPINRWVGKEDAVHIHKGILLDRKILPSAATWMSLEVIILREVRERKTDIIRRCLHVESKTWHINKPVKQKQAQTQRKALGSPKGRRVGQGGLGVWDWRTQATTYRTDKQGPTVQHSEPRSRSCDQPQWKRIWETIQICTVEPLCCIAEINTL